MLKIDAEGSDSEVIQGATGLISEKKVRVLKGGKVEFGRAVDSATGESFPTKLLVAVPPGSDEIPDEPIKQGRQLGGIEAEQG